MSGQSCTLGYLFLEQTATDLIENVSIFWQIYSGKL